MLIQNIKLFCMDVDGTLTDGKIHVGKHGEIFKSFNIRDGYAIKEILPNYNVIPIIITGRKSTIVANRCKELEIKELYQNCRNKKAVLLKLIKKYNCTLKNVAYIGDDIPDKECIQLCGISACPSDAEDNIKKDCDLICSKNGGNGAIREFVEWLIKED